RLDRSGRQPRARRLRNRLRREVGRDGPDRWQPRAELRRRERRRALALDRMGTISLDRWHKGSQGRYGLPARGRARGWSASIRQGYGQNRRPDDEIFQERSDHESLVLKVDLLSSNWRYRRRPKWLFPRGPI